MTATRRMKLLWVFPSFRAGGAQRRFATLVGALGEEYEHAVIALDGDYAAERMIPPGVAWRRVEVSTKRDGGVSIGAMWRFRRILARERPDILLTSNWGAIEWLLVNRGPGSAPQIHFEDGAAPEDAPGAAGDQRAWARRRAYPGKNRSFVAPSGEVRRRMIADWGAPESSVELIPHGVDIEAFAGARRDAPRETVRIGSVGALRPEKRFDRLLRLTATLRARGRAVEATLVGDGPERPALEALAAELGLSGAAHFLGAQADVAAQLEQMDVYAVTSDVEQAPLSLVEAMASGLPVVATRAGDVPEMLSKANRAFVRPIGDDSGLAAAAELLATDAETRAEIGGQNRDRAAARYSLEAMTARYDELFRATARTGSVLMLPAPSAP